MQLRQPRNEAKIEYLAHHNAVMSDFLTQSRPVYTLQSFVEYGGKNLLSACLEQKPHCMVNSIVAAQVQFMHNKVSRLYSLSTLQTGKLVGS